MCALQKIKKRAGFYMLKILCFLVLSVLFFSAGYGQWEPDVRLTNNVRSSSQPQIATNGNNNHMVWNDSRDDNYEIYYKRSLDNGTNWEADTRLTDAPAVSGWPSVAVSGLTVHVVWCDFRDGGFNVEIYYKRSLDNGRNWETDARLTNDPNYSYYPSVAVSDSIVHVVWYDERDGNYEIYYKRSLDNGTNWEPDTRLTDDPNVSWRPWVAVSDSIVHVIWNDTRDGNNEIYYKRSFDNGTTWGSDIRLTNDPGISTHPSVAVLGPIVHVTWYDDRDGDYEIYYKRSFDNGTNWEPDTRLTNASGNSYIPSVAVSDSIVHVTWYDNRDGNYEIYYKRNPRGNVGIDEKDVRWKIKDERLNANPNPFVDYTKVSGYENESFTLYDISGRLVGIYKGNQIGGDLSPGIYFLMPGTRNTKSVRIVKVRL